MKNRLINKNKIKKGGKEVLQDFFTAILPTKSCKNNSKTLFLHCIGLSLIFTIWRLDLQRRPTKFGRAYFFFSSLHIKMNGSLITCHFKHFNLIFYVTLCYVMLCYVMLCYVMLCYVMLCYVMLCYVMLCYVMLCYVIFILFYCILFYSLLLSLQEFDGRILPGKSCKN